MKKLRVNEADIPQLVAEFEQYLKTAKIGDGKLTFSKNIIPTKLESDSKVTILFKELAWMKMQQLIRIFDSECAWHGTVNRVDETHFEVDDVMVYPQEVTGVTVNTDQKEYEMWLMRQPDEVFNRLRFQAHSHVNMGVTPSATDETHQKKIIDQLGNDDFYIFLIINKRNEISCRVYDMATNCLYETADVVVQYEANELDNFIAVSKAQIKQKTYTTTNKYSGYGGYNYGGYNYGKTYGANSNLHSSSTKKDDLKTDEDENTYKNRNAVALRQMAEDEEDDEAWWNRYSKIYGYSDDPCDGEDELPGYPNYNAAVRNGKKV